MQACKDCTPNEGWVEDRAIDENPMRVEQAELCTGIGECAAG